MGAGILVFQVILMRGHSVGLSSTGGHNDFVLQVLLQFTNQINCKKKCFLQMDGMTFRL